MGKRRAKRGTAGKYGAARRGPGTVSEKESRKRAARGNTLTSCWCPFLAEGEKAPLQQVTRLELGEWQRRKERST